MGLKRILFAYTTQNSSAGSIRKKENEREEERREQGKGREEKRERGRWEVRKKPDFTECYLQ